MNYNDLKKMWESFGYYTLEVDGHNFDELLKAYNDNSEKSKPKIVIANTIKGKGISFAENDNNWHRTVLTKNLYDKAMEELKMKLDKEKLKYGQQLDQATFGMAILELAKLEEDLMVLTSDVSTSAGLDEFKNILTSILMLELQNKT